eukprot:CAMPEP_0204255026 /NCGR_PEP_ID=MMETSP0468-20130131/2942_1 /ASSEMBLY_ACC=CAM_ASM_000383 /TAXON_ID=2969 /ORGANISM="Oxyrrhis marina" /LENGTH=645 /DNA_ID=CAMNT_0051228853 /DNA_START=138 /DNA_END=2075 /DNA_ORIENTATION=+
MRATFFGLVVTGVAAYSGGWGSLREQFLHPGTAAATVLSELVHLDDPKDAPPVVVHKKKAGGGYKKGSPLYDKQQQKKNQTTTPKPAVKEQTCTEPVPKVSTTMECVVTLLCIFFAVHTANMVARTINSFTGTATKLVEIMQAGVSVVNLAPMLGLLFIGTRLRAIYLAQGPPEKYDLPQDWVQGAMQAASWSLLILVLAAVALPAVGPDAKSGSGGGAAGLAVVAVKVAAAVVVNSCALVVAIGAVVMEAPDSVWGNKEPAVSPALDGLLVLSCQYFTVLAGLEVVRAVMQFTSAGQSVTVQNVEASLVSTAVHAQIAPVLGVLFLAARMRKVETKTDDIPEEVMTACFYVAAYTLLVMLVVVFVLPVAFGGQCRTVDGEADTVLEGGKPAIATAFVVCRLVAMSIIAVAMTVIIWGIYAYERAGKEATPAMFSVVTIGLTYFVIFAALFLALGVKQLTMGPNPQSSSALRTTCVAFDAARMSAMFGLMLAVLILGVHMRAKSITYNKGHPQTYAQQAMFIVTFTVLAQCIMAFILPFVAGGPTIVDGEIDPAAVRNKTVGIVMNTLKYLCLFLLYACAIALIVSLFTMDCENTAEGRVGSDFGLGDLGSSTGSDSMGGNSTGSESSEGGDAQFEMTTIAPKFF